MYSHQNNPITHGTGWLPPKPDLRDYTPTHKEIIPIITKLGFGSSQTLPSKVDLRKWCSPIENQGNLGSCTAQAGIGIIEYFEIRSFNKHTEWSRLFLYKVTRNLMQVKGDTGAWIRETMGALAHCGVPAEKYWPYNIADFDKEPDAFVYALADNYEAIKYFCHDPVGRELGAGSKGQEAESMEQRAGSKEQEKEGRGLASDSIKPHAPRSLLPASASSEVLVSVKKYLEAGIPSMFGFWGFPSFESTDTKGGIPYPTYAEKAAWGHAIVAVGYDDTKKIKNTISNKETTGAILIRNSWGKEWGDKGYGWLPYEYVLNNLAMDFWSILSMEWIDSGQFGL
jgi:C1A family cysteine protease